MINDVMYVALCSPGSVSSPSALHPWDLPRWMLNIISKSHASLGFPFHFSEEIKGESKYLYKQIHIQFSSIHWLIRSLGVEDMKDKLAEILFQSFWQEAIVSSSGMGRDVHSLTLSIQFFLCCPMKDGTMFYNAVDGVHLLCIQCDALSEVNTAVICDV